MELSLSETRTHFCKVVQDLLDGRENVVIVTKNGSPAVQITIYNPKNNKRIGAAKNEMAGFDISLEEFNAITF